MNAKRILDTLQTLVLVILWTVLTTWPHCDHSMDNKLHETHFITIWTEYNGTSHAVEVYFSQWIHIIVTLDTLRSLWYSLHILANLWTHYDHSCFGLWTHCDHSMDTLVSIDTMNTHEYSIYTMWSFCRHFGHHAHSIETSGHPGNACQFLLRFGIPFPNWLQCSVQCSVIGTISQKHAPCENESMPALEVIEQQLQTTWPTMWHTMWYEGYYPGGTVSV